MVGADTAGGFIEQTRYDVAQAGWQAQAAAATADGAVRLMAEQPSIIKRPVLERKAVFRRLFRRKLSRNFFKITRYGGMGSSEK